MINFENIKKTLIVRLSSLGDILLTTPVVRSLKEKYPDIKIDFLLKQQFADVYKFNTNINNLILFDSSQPSICRDEIINGQYDLIIDLQNNLRTFFLLKSVQTKKVKFKKPSLKKYLLVKTKINLFKKILSIPELYSRVIASDLLDEDGLELYNAEGRIQQCQQTEKAIGFCPGAKHFSKRWLSEYFVKLGNMLAKEGFTIYLFGGAQEKELCSQLNLKINNSINCVSKDDLIFTAQKMSNCRLVVTNDSALMHVAAAIKIPIVVIFGSSVREFGFTPYNVENVVVELNNLTCRPCSHIGNNKCPKEHFDCMKKIKPEIVYEKIKMMIKNYE